MRFELTADGSKIKLDTTTFRRSRADATTGVVKTTPARLVAEDTVVMPTDETVMVTPGSLWLERKAQAVGLWNCSAPVVAVTVEEAKSICTMEPVPGDE